MCQNRNGTRLYDTGYLVAVSAIHGFPNASGDPALKILRHNIQGGISMAGLRGGLPNLDSGGLLEHLLNKELHLVHLLDYILKACLSPKNCFALINLEG